MKSNFLIALTQLAAERNLDRDTILSAVEEAKYTIAQANSHINKEGRFTEELVSCRKALNFILAKPDLIE